MNKLMIAAAAALCATVTFADGISSANIVGYNSITVQPNEWNLVGNGFAPVDGGESQSIQTMITGLTAEDDAGQAPVIQYWDGSTLLSAFYVTYSYYVDGDDIVELGDSWAIGQGAQEGETCFKVFAPGEACWFKVKGSSPQTVTFSGAVQGSMTKDVSLTTSWNFVGNPYPISYTLNDTAKVDCSGLTATDDAGQAPVIQYWDGTKLVSTVYVTYSYYVDGDDIVELGDSWAIGEGDQEGETCFWQFSPCQGYWAKTKQGTGVITFKR